MAVDSWSTTPAGNATTLGIDIGENSAAANMNDALRQAMADIKAKFDAVASGSGAGLQPEDATLTALSGLTTAANQVIYATGADSFAVTALTAFARTLLDDADAATACSTLGAIRATSVSITNPGGVTIVTASGTFGIRWGTFTAGANTTTGVTYSPAPHVGATTSFAVVNGVGEFGTGTQSTQPTASSCSSTGFNCFSGADSSCTSFYIAIVI